MSTNNWRFDPGLKSSVIYKKRFALISTQCTDGEYVWLKNYYKKYEIWGPDAPPEGLGHVDFIENITEADYIVRRLTEGF